MLVRLVRMGFVPERLSDFRELFEATRERIAAQPGCHKVELWADDRQPHVLYTLSHWDGPEALEQYRQSELFEQVWRQTKPWFAEKPQAFSLVEPPAPDAAGGPLLA